MKSDDKRYPRNWLSKVQGARDFPDLVPLQRAMEAVFTSQRLTPQMEADLETARAWFEQEYPMPWEEGLFSLNLGLSEKMNAIKWRMALTLLGEFPGETLATMYGLPHSVPGAVERILDLVLSDADKAGLPMEVFPELPPEALEASRRRRSVAGA